MKEWEVSRSAEVRQPFAECISDNGLTDLNQKDAISHG